MSNRKVWISRVFTAVITFALTATAILKIAHAQGMVKGLANAGIPPAAVVPIAVLEVVCLALYLVPRTAVLGAVLLTGYFGGAMVVHIIGGESIFPIVMLGVWVWGGIYFRVPGLPSLLPFRRDTKVARRAAEVRGERSLEASRA